jgi:hypothetical protein
MGRHCKWEEFFDEWASGTGVMTRFSRAERPSTTPSMNILSDISEIVLVADMGHPRSDGSPRGRHSFGAGDSRSLPWAMNAQRSELFPLPLPPSQPATTLARGRKHIDPRPDLGGRAPAQMLMRPEVVIDRSNLLQGLITRGRIVDRMVPQQSFDRADQALDPAILPRAARLTVLQANAEKKREKKRGQATFL